MIKEARKVAQAMTLIAVERSGKSCLRMVVGPQSARSITSDRQTIPDNRPPAEQFSD
jgi:hypothetical protein